MVAGDGHAATGKGLVFAMQRSGKFPERELAHGRLREQPSPEALREVRRSLEQKEALEAEHLDPGPWVATLVAHGGATVLGARGAGVRVANWSLPSEDAPIGLVDDGVHVTCKARIDAATLLMPAASEQCAMLMPRSVRVFRYEPATASYFPCLLSGVGITGDYVWARIGGSGHYAAIGLYADAIALAVVQMLQTARGLVLHLPIDVRKAKLSALVEHVAGLPVAPDSREPGKSVPMKRLTEDGLLANSLDSPQAGGLHAALLRLANRAAAESEPPEIELLRLLRSAAR